MMTKSNRPHAILILLLLAALEAPAWCAAPAKPGLPSEGDHATLRAAIQDLIVTFGDQYPEGEKFLSRLDQMETSLKAPKARAQFLELQRQALTANPLVGGNPILFVVRNQYKKDHHNSATMFKTGEINTASYKGGGAMKSIDFGEGGRVRTLIDAGEEGLARDPDVSFDGTQIIFALRKNIRENYHLYEINADGTDLNQLTCEAGVVDIDPLYLPDGGIIFSSTREPKYCMCNCHIMANLFRMDGDGANILQIGKSTLHEAHGALMPDGRILYDRWEYVDRNFGDAQSLWTVNPDGTNHAVYWGNNTWSPGGVIDARPIPGTQRIVCVFTSCHDRPWGALAIVDRRLGVDGPDSVVRTWPADAKGLMGNSGKNKKGYGFDNFKNANPKYEDPYPLSDKYILSSRMTGEGERTGIYLLDTFGNEILLHTEGEGCFDPMPLAPRERPEAIPARRDYQNQLGTFFVTDVYQGTHMKGVERGEVKSLRVVESPEKRFWTTTSWGGQGVHKPAMNWHGFENKRILGTVPVEEDGSVHFTLPSDKFVYFQLLDADGMMIQSMRSGTMVQSGERQGCVGCHDNRTAAPPPTKKAIPMAFSRPPSPLEGWRGEARLFSYLDEVQPVFDKNCVKCHDYGKKGAKKLLLAADRTMTFNTSYNELWRKKYIQSIGAGPYDIQQPRSWGSYPSKIIQVIREGHNKVQLDPEDFNRLVTWIDINAPYYANYSSAYPKNLAGRSPLDNKQIARLTKLTGVAFANLAKHSTNLGPQVSFDRPELSPCLAKLRKQNTPEARDAIAEALFIIRAGSATLAATPRADMPGFQACPTDQKRQEKYLARQAVENRNRQAILTGAKYYD